MLSPYRDILSIPGARRFVAWGLIARIQMGMTGLATFLLVQIQYDSYGTAGMVLAAISLSYAALAPQVARIVDNYGQSAVLKWGYSIAVVGRIALILAALTMQPVWVLLAITPTFAAAGAQSTLTRARWTHVVRNRDQLNTAFSLEISLEEILFIVGPVLATIMAIQLAPWSPSAVALVTQAVGGYMFLRQRDTEPPVRARSVDAGVTEAALSVAPTTATAGIALPNVTAASALRRRRYRNPFAASLLLTTPVLMMVMVVFLTQGMLFASIDASTVAFADEQNAKSLAGVVLAVWALGALVGGVLYGARIWRRTLASRLFIGVAVVGVGTATFMHAPSLGVLAILMFITGLAIAPTLAVGDSIVHSVVPRGRMTEGLTWTRFGIDFGIALGAWGAGTAIDQFGAVGGFSITAGAGLLGIVLVAAAWRRIRSAPDNSVFEDSITVAHRPATEEIPQPAFA